MIVVKGQRLCTTRSISALQARVAALDGVTRAAVVAAAARASGLPTWVLTGQRRDPQSVRPRFAASWVMRCCGWSLPQIGAALGGRDHTTARHAVLRCHALLAGNDAEMKAFVGCLIDRLEGRPGPSLVPARAPATPVGQAAAPAVSRADPVRRDGRPKRLDPAPAAVVPVAVLIPAAVLDRARQMRRWGGTLKGCAKVLGVAADDLARALGQPLVREAA